MVYQSVNYKQPSNIHVKPHTKAQEQFSLSRFYHAVHYVHHAVHNAYSICPSVCYGEVP